MNEENMKKAKMNKEREEIIRINRENIDLQKGPFSKSNRFNCPFQSPLVISPYASNSLYASNPPFASNPICQMSRPSICLMAGSEDMCPKNPENTLEELRAQIAKLEPGIRTVVHKTKAKDMAKKPELT